MARSVLRTIDSTLYRNECEQEVINVHQRSMQVKQVVDEIKVFPNPANTELNIVCKDAAIRYIDIYNYLGEKVYSAKIVDAENKIQLSSFDAGIYSLKISTDSEILSTQSITVIH